MRQMALWATLLALLATPWTATAGSTIYSNFGPGQSYGSGYYSVAGGQSSGDPGPPMGYGFAVAESFTPTDAFHFEKVTVALTFLQGVNGFTINLMSDLAGHPGGILDSFPIAGVPLFPGSAVVSGTSLTHTPLIAGTTYWVAVMPQDRTTAGGWMMNSTGAMGWSRTGNDGVTWSAQTGEAPALEVEGVPVPEPTSLALLGVALAALGVTRPRKGGR